MDEDGAFAAPSISDAVRTVVNSRDGILGLVKFTPNAKKHVVHLKRTLKRRTTRK